MTTGKLPRSTNLVQVTPKTETGSDDTTTTGAASGGDGGRMLDEVDNIGSGVVAVSMKTAAGAPWVGSREQRLWRLHLRMMTQLLIRIDGELTERHGLTIADYSVLVVVAEGQEGGVRMSTLAEMVMISRSRLTHCIDRLEARGLAIREKAMDDRRGYRVVLKPKGFKLLNEAVPTHVTGVRQYFVDNLDMSELDVLEGFVKRVLGSLDRASDELPADGHLTIDDLGPRS
jgi:DNA-binding MarR family transcriptional regulator